MYYILLTIATILLAGNFVITKLYQKKKGTSPKAGLLFNALSGLFMAIIFLCISAFEIKFTPFSLAMSVLSSVLMMSYTLIGFKLLKGGTMADYMLFLMTGGMIVPYIYGILFLNEDFTIIRTLALLVIVAGVVIANYSEEKISLKRLLMCISVFLLNGFVSIAYKVH